jgi:HPt (histidine-containing phosphotransfer) domain-containing protein
MTLLTYLSDGTPRGLDAQIQRFFVTLHETADRLSAAVKALEFHDASATAHQLHGQAKLVGCAALADAVSKLELAALARDGAACSACLPRVSVEIQVLTEAMRRHRTAVTSA